MRVVFQNIRCKYKLITILCFLYNRSERIFAEYLQTRSQSIFISVQIALHIVMEILQQTLVRQPLNPIKSNNQSRIFSKI